MDKELAHLEENRRYWRTLVEQGTSSGCYFNVVWRRLRRFHKNCTGVEVVYQKWVSLPTALDNSVFPSPSFRLAFENIPKLFNSETDAGRRIYLNLFLSDILMRPEFEGRLRIYPEIRISVETVQKRVLRGITDNTVGFCDNIGPFDDKLPPGLHLVSIEAENDLLALMTFRNALLILQLFTKVERMPRAKIATFGGDFECRPLEIYFYQ